MCLQRSHVHKLRCIRYSSRRAARSGHTACYSFGKCHCSNSRGSRFHRKYCSNPLSNRECILWEVIFPRTCHILRTFRYTIRDARSIHRTTHRYYRRSYARIQRRTLHTYDHTIRWNACRRKHIVYMSPLSSSGDSRSYYIRNSKCCPRTASNCDHRVFRRFDIHPRRSNESR